MATSYYAGLKRRREKLSARLIAAQKSTTKLKRDLRRVNLAIEDYESGAAVVSRARRILVSRIALGIMRTATEPMTVRALVMGVMATAGEDTSDGNHVLARMERLRVLLNRYAKAGLLRRIEGPGQAVLWEVAR